MANTYVDYTGDGSETDFAINFDYIKTSHVAVEVNEGPAGGTNTWVRKTLGSDYTVATSPTKQVVFTAAPANLVRVRVLRDSDANVGIVDFANGSVLTETELDNAYNHNRYLAQEAEEGVSGGTITKNDDGQFNADGLRLENLAAPDSDDDAVTKGYADDRYVNSDGDTMNGPLSMDGNNITGVNSVQGLVAPTSDNHAASKEYVDDQDALQVTRSGDSMSGTLAMGDGVTNNKITNLGSPDTGTDAANKAYVDDEVADEASNRASGDATLTNSKVSKSGDTMTGALTLPASNPSDNNHATRKAYVDAQIAAAISTGTPGGQIDTVNIADDAVTAAKLDHTTVTAGSYTNTDITVDENGRITAASNGSSGAGATNLSNTPAASSVDIESSTGTNTTVAGATTSLAGVMTSADKTKLDGIATGATANSSDATLLNRANHTGTQTAATISDFNTEVANNTAVAANTAKVTNATHTGDVTGSTALTIANGAVTHDKISSTDSVFKINSSNQVRLGGDLNDSTLQSISQFGITSSTTGAVATIESTNSSSQAALVLAGAESGNLQLRDGSTTGTDNGIFNVSSDSGRFRIGSIKDDQTPRGFMFSVFPKGTTDGGVCLIEPLTVSELNASQTGFTPSSGMIAYVSNGDSGSPCLAVHDGSSFKRVALGSTISAT